MKICITIDMEHDCPPQFTTYRGVEGRTPALLSLFESNGIPAIFFTTGDVARKYPEVIKQIVDQGHELGCHGDTHHRFDGMDAPTPKKENKDSSEILRKYYPVSSFRAPNLAFPNQYLRRGDF